MATFKPVVGPMKKSGTANIKIRIVCRSTNTLVSTNINVVPSQLSRSGALRDQRVIDACENLLREWRAAVAELGAAAAKYDAKQLAAYLKRYGGSCDSFRLDFVKWIHTFANTKVRSTRHNYVVVANSLDRFFNGRSTDINEITAQVLSAYLEWLRSEGIAPGTIAQYFSLIRSAHNAARYKYNDEDMGVVCIARQPFIKFKAPKEPAPEPRNIDLATLQAIADLDDDKRINTSLNYVRDLFMLSFALGGMNYVDIYNLPYSALKGNYIEYRRQKTRKARMDGALYRVNICAEVMPLLERWLDPSRKRLFRFYEIISWSSLPTTIYRMMKAIENMCPFERHYTFYAARHTYASLGYNVAAIDKYTVHELLNHSDEKMRITDRYIERDWSRLYEAHSKIINLVDWTKISKI